MSGISTPRAWYIVLVGELEFWLSVWDFRYRKGKPPCSNSMLCECNRRSCPYRQVSVVTYVRKLKMMEVRDDTDKRKQARLSNRQPA